MSGWSSGSGGDGCVLRSGGSAQRPAIGSETVRMNARNQRHGQAAPGWDARGGVLRMAWLFTPLVCFSHCLVTCTSRATAGRLCKRPTGTGARRGGHELS